MLELFHSTSQPPNQKTQIGIALPRSVFTLPLCICTSRQYSAGGPTSKLLRTDLIESIKTDLIDLIEALPGWSGLIFLRKDSVIWHFTIFSWLMADGYMAHVSDLTPGFLNLSN